LQRQSDNRPKTKDLTEKVGRAFSRAGRTVEAAGEKVQQRLKQDGWDEEAERLIGYFNDEVVPAIRSHSSEALKVASRKLSRLAELLEEGRG
jgi:hypothetical protein